MINFVCESVAESVAFRQVVLSGFELRQLKELRVIALVDICLK